MQILSTLRSGSLMTWAFLRLVYNPLADLSPVFKLAAGLSDPDYIDSVEASFDGCDHARDAMVSQHRLGAVDLAALRKLPAGTLGREFVGFLDKNKLDIEALPIQGVDQRGGYLVAHLYETHDIWHVVFGFEPDIAGEIGLQAAYAAQFPAKLPLMLIPAILLNTLLFAFGDTRRRMDALVRGWILGSEARTLVGVRWNRLWETDLEVLRTQFGIARPPRRAVLELAAAGT